MKKNKYVILFIILFVSCCSNKSQQKILVTSDTMKPNIVPGDYVILNTTDREFTYGDVVGYYYEGGYDVDYYVEPFNDIFRIVAIPGDSIGIENGICIVNGKKNRHLPIKYSLIEEELSNGMKINIRFYTPDDERSHIPVKIPEDHFFVMGDFRGISLDSRFFGPVHKDKILGKIVKVIKEE